ncbi:MAG: glycosyltransferase [Muribaculaceae bacterium]|nr:glycosyltransferase [Muribaculaceae bacterium]
MADEPNPVVSIIMPVKDGQRFVAQAIESVLAQTYTNFELIIVNDGSTDLSAKIIEQYASIDNRIKFISLENNYGVSVARNKGIELAIGRHISFIDSDDIMAPELIERMLKINEITGAEIVLANYTLSLKELSKGDNLPNVLSPINAVSNMLYQKKGFDSALFAKLIDCNLLKDSQFAPGIRYEDLLFLPEIYLKANKIAKIDGRLYYYRRNHDGFMCDNSRKHLDLLYVTEKLRQDLFPKYPILEKALIHRRFSALMNILKRCYKNGLKLDINNKSLIINEIKQLVPMALKDSNARMKNRLGAVLALSGIPILKFAMKCS